MKYKFIAGHRYFTRISGVESLFTADANTASVAVTFGSDDIVDLTQMQSSDAFDTASAFSSMYPGHHPYDTGRLLNFTGTGIKTVGFNVLAPNGTAHLLGGNAYEIVGTYTALSYSTGETITPISGIFTPSAGGILTVSGHDGTTCVHLVWSGYRNGEYEPYWSATKSLPVSTYFPDGMKSVGTVIDELTNGKAIQRCAKRAYQIGDEDDSTVVTDGTNTVYVLSSPVETVISPPLDLSFRSADYGTEMLLPENDDEPVTTPMYADISYVQNLRDKLQRLPMSPSAEGDYIVHYDGVNQRYKAIPAVPSGDGVYTLKCTVTGGEPVFAWVSDTPEVTGE